MRPKIMATQSTAKKTTKVKAAPKAAHGAKTKVSLIRTGFRGGCLV
ncbi:MAG TPA: hypothetical protein VN043_05670 [Rhodanobacter sp.]|nr:hypothetical protein [Rhodanobacter sp.]